MFALTANGGTARQHTVLPEDYCVTYHTSQYVEHRQTLR